MSSASTAAGPDVRQIQTDELAETPFPAGRPTFRVYLDPEVHASIQRHTRENLGVEVCGVVVGKWARDGEGPYALISASIRGEAATSKFAEVTFTHETWAKINAEMDSRYGDLRIVGWYHSHPDFGVFLSDRDRFIQEHFFNAPGQIAYVVDPLRHTEGVFIWRDGKPTLSPSYWVGSRLQVSTAAGEESSRVPAAIAAQPVPTPRPPDRLRLPWGFLALLMFTFIVLGYLLAGRMNDLERLRIEQGTLARSVLYLQLRSGLREELDGVERGLAQANQTLTGLARDHSKQPESKDGAKTQWESALAELERARRRLVSVQAVYCLTAEESALLERILEARRQSPTTTDKPKAKDGEEAKKP